MDNIFKQTACYIGIDNCKPFSLPYLGIYMSLGVASEGIEYNSTLHPPAKIISASDDRLHSRNTSNLVYSEIHIIKISLIYIIRLAKTCSFQWYKWQSVFCRIYTYNVR